MSVDSYSSSGEVMLRFYDGRSLVVALCPGMPSGVTEAYQVRSGGWRFMSGDSYMGVGWTREQMEEVLKES